MVVYADILMLVNFIVDYFLLAATALLLKRRVTLWRSLLGAAVGAVSSLYIFLPQSAFFLEVLIRFLISAVITLCTFGFKRLKDFLRATVCFFAVTFLYAGAMMALWLLLRPDGMVINNSVVYFNISPLFLILFSVAGYFLSAVARLLLSKKSASAKRCSVTLKVGEKRVTREAIVDSGNSLSDAFGLSEVIISDSNTATSLLGSLSSDFCRSRYRAIPCGTVAATDILDGYRLDSAAISFDGKEKLIDKPILAISKVKLQDCEAIINPKTIEL